MWFDKVISSGCKRWWEWDGYTDSAVPFKVVCTERNLQATNFQIHSALFTLFSLVKVFRAKSQPNSCPPHLVSYWDESVTVILYGHFSQITPKQVQALLKAHEPTCIETEKAYHNPTDLILFFYTICLHQNMILSFLRTQNQQFLHKWGIKYLMNSTEILARRLIGVVC